MGINHVALEVGDIDEALAFYGQFFDLTLRGRSSQMAFIDMGDQFLALSRSRVAESDTHRHFGLVVDDKEGTRQALESAGVEILPGRGLDFRDPWGNLVQIVQYDEVQFTKTAAGSARRWGSSSARASAPWLSFGRRGSSRSPDRRGKRSGLRWKAGAQAAAGPFARRCRREANDLLR